MPVIPRKLAAALKDAGYIQRELARRLEINPKYINDFFKKGKEPKNPEIRAKMFLPRRARQPRGPHKPRTPMQEAINRMAKATRRAVIHTEKPHGS